MPSNEQVWPQNVAQLLAHHCLVSLICRVSYEPLRLMNVYWKIIHPEDFMNRRYRGAACITLNFPLTSVVNMKARAAMVMHQHAAQLGLTHSLSFDATEDHSFSFANTKGNS